MLNVEICSKKAILERIASGFPSHAAVISFNSPPNPRRNDYSRAYPDRVCDRVFYVEIPDIDIELLSEYGYTYDSYLNEADKLAHFIYDAYREKCTIICQCDYGQSRSAACAAAILQHFEGRGIDIFADYRYYPNQLVYHKVLDALVKLQTSG